MKKDKKTTRKKPQLVAIPFDSVRELLEQYAARTEKVFVERLREHEEREDANLRELIEKLVMTGRSFDAMDARRAQERREIEAKIDAVQLRVDALEKSHEINSDDIRKLRGILEPLKDIIEVFKRTHGLSGG